MQHDMSALHRLNLVSWIVFIAFLLFAITSVVSLLYTGKNLDKLIERNLIPAIDSSRTALDLGRSLADVNYILSACRSDEFSGDGVGGNVLSSLSSLADDTNDKVLNESLVQFMSQFESILANCQSVRETEQEINLANKKLFNIISSLDKAVADLIIEGRLKGNDTTILERLPLSITKFMNIQLRLNSLYSNFGDFFFKRELIKKHHRVLATLDEFALETRILSGYGKEIERHGNQIKRLLQVLVDHTEQYNQVAKEFFSSKQKLKATQKSLLKYLEAAESSLHVSSQQRAKSLKKNFNRIPLVGFLLIGLPLIIVLFSAQLARSAYKSLKRTWGMRDKAEEKLHKAHRDLEVRVKERTAELAEANKILKVEIAERIEVERSLKKREFQLTETQKVAEIGNWDLDLIAPKLDWSNETYKLFDKDPESFVPSFDEFARLVHPNDFKTMQTKFDNALKNDEKPYHVEVRIINDSGREWVMEAFGKVIRDNNGKALSIFGTVQNVTERSLVEALQKSEKRFKDLAENSTDFIWEFDENEIFTYASPSIKNLLGYLPEEIIGKSAFDPMSSPESERVMKEFVIYKDARESFSALLNINQHKNGRQVVIESSGVPIIDSEGGFHGYRGIDRDITERKKMEARLLQAQKMESIGNLAGGIAHDFNNLLFPIIGMSEMLLEDLPEDSLEYDNAKEIFHAGKRAGELVNQILSFSRQTEHKMTPVRIQNVLKEVLRLSRSTIPVNIGIHQNIQNNCGMVMADSTQIHQIAMNLITNAFHAVEANNGKIEIELKEIILKKKELPDSTLPPGDYAKLSVSDNGVGISPQIIGKIFEPYFTTKEHGKGTGLGLAMVFGIVKTHIGDIKVYSEEGKGTTFNIYLPLMKRASDIIAIEKSSETLTGMERILIIDDEVSIAKLEGQMLSRLGYQVTSKTNSIEALNTFKANPQSFDLVISDMTMPHMTGDKLSKEILSIKPDIPIIICTGFSERINKEQIQDIGVKIFLMKPVLNSHLARVVRQVLDEAKLHKGV